MHAPTVRAECGTASSAPCPTPTPTNAFLSLDVTGGPASTQITVNGGAFLSNEHMTLYWDQADHVAGGAIADANGNFVAPNIKPFAGDAPGVHHLCASVPPNPCANFTLMAPAASPSPSPTPTESPSPSASPEATLNPTASPTPVVATLSGFDVISRPPFVFLPIFGFGAILLALAYWAFSLMRRPARPALLPSAAVVHRATRPDYSANFGAPPVADNHAPEPSAWNEPMRVSSAPAAEPAVPSAVPPPAAAGPVEWGPPVEWGTGTSEWGIPEPPLRDEELPPRD